MVAQPEAPAVVDLHHLDVEVVTVERGEVLLDVGGGHLLEVAVPGAPDARRGPDDDAGRERGDGVRERRPD